jgi:hypothetical protein
LAEVGLLTGCAGKAKVRSGIKLIAESRWPETSTTVR